MKRYLKHFGVATSLGILAVAVFAFSQLVNLPPTGERIAAAISVISLIVGALLAREALQSKAFADDYRKEIQKIEYDSKKPENQWKEKIKVLLGLAFLAALWSMRLLRASGHRDAAVVILVIASAAVVIFVITKIIIGIYKKAVKKDK